MVFYALMFVPYDINLCGEVPQKWSQLGKQVIENSEANQSDGF